MAESVKTSAWRFCCRAHPYENVDRRTIAVKNFLTDLNSIRDDNEFIGESLDESYSDSEQITEVMFQIRALSVIERLEYYVEKRVKEQRSWYAKKAGFNKRRKKFWFIFAIISYILLFLVIFAERFSIYEMSFGVNALLVAITSSIGWLQIKRHGELAASYQLTAHEIGSLVQLKGEVDSEAALSEYVNKAEFAFSREHTQWAARSSTL